MLNVTLPSAFEPMSPKEEILEDLHDPEITARGINLLAVICEWLDPRQRHSFTIEMPGLKYTTLFSRDLPTLLSQLPSVISAIDGEQPSSSMIDFCEQGFECDIRIRCEKQEAYISVIDSQYTAPQLRVDSLQVNRGELAGDFRRVAQQFTERIKSQLPELLAVEPFQEWVRGCGGAL